MDGVMMGYRQGMMPTDSKDRQKQTASAGLSQILQQGEHYHFTVQISVNLAHLPATTFVPSHGRF